MYAILCPLRIAVLLFPAFTALDVFGPLGVLNVLALNHSMTLSLLSTNMNPISIDRNIIDGVYEGNPDRESHYFTQYVLPTHTLDDAPEADVIIVPGGGGTRNISATQPHVDWLKTQVNDPALSYMMTVCTGASLLARTGEIAGRNATTNKAAFNWVKSVEYADEVNWIPKARWVVDGHVWTSSGVSAGTDMTLGWVEHMYGKEEKERIRIGMEWNALEQEDDPFAEIMGLV
ncbi:unnamed protein product [Parascedosporium putredinis]|uniref:DJ-1/PfpI domain-containing protein n=1 Tax=Parascedosporium putredinis TaxID=1442378 RepID=A0A9P1M8P9_9PEZI|nr:unnamed protein product [Parascedosporium putredinis]CAI7994014.1 unnamed protein product [Parascedosporium putredinis]